ncbi:uncharacterized protein DS421_9g259040 [Arachis hypogaea]|nr:uncharacterized protein DS421_9g259040 [Arachis hypogaea]
MRSRDKCHAYAGCHAYAWPGEFLPHTYAWGTRTHSLALIKSLFFMNSSSCIFFFSFFLSNPCPPKHEITKQIYQCIEWNQSELNIAI